MDEEMEKLQVRELREKTGMTQGQFAEYYGLKVRTLQGWERGKRPPEGIVPMMERILEQETYIQQLEEKLRQYEEAMPGNDPTTDTAPSLDKGSQ